METKMKGNTTAMKKSKTIINEQLNGVASTFEIGKWQNLETKVEK